MRPVRERPLWISGRPAVKSHCQRSGRVARAWIEVPGGEHLDPGGAAAQRRDNLQVQRVLTVHPALAPDARGVPVPAAVAYPYHRSLIQFIRIIAHRVIRVVADTAAHRAAGMRVHDGAALAVVQAEGRPA